MKQVPFEVINKSGQPISFQLFRYKDDYPAKFYYFNVEEGSRKRPQSGTWEVWKGDYNLIVFGENMSECLLPIDINDKEAGIDITIKGRFRLVVPPCQEIFSNSGERSLLKYNWARSFTKDPDTGADSSLSQLVHNSGSIMICHTFGVSSRANETELGSS